MKEQWKTGFYGILLIFSDIELISCIVFYVAATDIEQKKIGILINYHVNINIHTCINSKGTENCNYIEIVKIHCVQKKLFKVKNGFLGIF